MEPNLRCSVCAKPLFMPAAPTRQHATEALQRKVEAGQAWSSRAVEAMGGVGTVVYSNKTALHRGCLEELRLAEADTAPIAELGKLVNLASLS